MVLDFLKRPKQDGGKEQDTGAIEDARGKPATKVGEEQLEQQAEADTQLVLPRSDEQTTLSGGRVQDESGDETSQPRPVLGDEDERFFNEAAFEAEPHLQHRGSITITDDGEEIENQSADDATQTPEEEVVPNSEGEPSTQHGKKRKFNYWSFVPQLPSKQFLSGVPTMAAMTDISSWRPTSRGKDQVLAADDLMSAAKVVKENATAHEKPLTPPAAVATDAIDEEEKKEEQRDISAILGNLNLSSINNRVFSISKDSQILLERFNIVLKDIVNGVPTAYHDLETLLTEQHAQLDKMFRRMPPFVQTLVKSLPAKMMSAYAPAMLATSVTAADADASAKDEKSSAKKKQKRSFIPSVKSLVYEKGAVVTMLQSIIQFLKMRFPVLLAGTNVLMSLAVFILLFVFWYCHKRGKEVRLSNEAQNAQPLDEEAGAIPMATTANNLATDNPSLQALESKTTLEDSNYQSTVVAGAAKATLPDNIPLPRIDVLETETLSRPVPTDGEVLVRPPMAEVWARNDNQQGGRSGPV